MSRPAALSPPIPSPAILGRNLISAHVQRGALVLVLIALAGCTPVASDDVEEHNEPVFKSLDVTFVPPTGAPDPQATSGEIPGFRDADNYTYDISFRLAYRAVTKDVSQSPPGRALVTLTADYSAAITNTTEGRDAPLGNLRTFAVVAAFATGSAVCGQKAPGNVWSPGDGALGSYCLRYFVPTFLPETGVQPGERYDASKSVELVGEGTEAEVDAMVAELTAGPAFWLAWNDPDPGLVSSCDGGPGTEIAWLSTAAVDCPGALVAPASVAIDTSADLAAGADAGFDQTIQPFYSSGTGDLANCPLGDLPSITTGLAGLVETGDAFSSITVRADKDPAARTEILCDSDQLRFMVLQRVTDKGPLDDFVADGDALSADFPYLAARWRCGARTAWPIVTPFGSRIMS